MPPKSLEWKRILTAKPQPQETDQTANGGEILTPSSAASIGVVLQSYEQLYLEKEQLRDECIELRREISRLTKRPQKPVQRETVVPGATDAFEVLNRLNGCIASLQTSIRALEDHVQRMEEARSAVCEPDLKSQVFRDGNGSGQSTRVSPEIGDGARRSSVAELVAEWMFARPNAAQIRLVEDALRGQGVRIS